MVHLSPKRSKLQAMGQGERRLAAGAGFFEHRATGAARFDETELLHLNAKLLHHLPWDAVKDRLPGATEAFWLAVRGNVRVATAANETGEQAAYDVGVTGRRGPGELVHDQRVDPGKGLAQTIEVLVMMEGIAARPIDQPDIGIGQRLPVVFVGLPRSQQHVRNPRDGHRCARLALRSVAKTFHSSRDIFWRKARGS